MQKHIGLENIKSKQNQIKEMIHNSYGRTNEHTERNNGAGLAKSEMRKVNVSPPRATKNGLVYQTLDGRVLNNDDLGVTPKTEKKNNKRDELNSVSPMLGSPEPKIPIVSRNSGDKKHNQYLLSDQLKQKNNNNASLIPTKLI